MVLDPVSLNSLTFSVVGAGKVGSSLAHWLVSNGSQLNMVASRSPETASHLADTLAGFATPLSQISSDDDDLLLIAVADHALQEVTGTLARLRQAPVVLHTSGRATGETLAPLRPHGSAVGSLHPLKAFPAVLKNPIEAAGTVFGIDGDDRAQAMARRLVAGLSGLATVIPPATRSQYHLAATLAAGGVVTLLASAAELAETVGLGPDVVAGYLELARGAVRRAADGDSIAAAITGPVARGDLQEFRSQIEEIRTLDPELADFLQILAKRTVHHCQGHASRDSKLPRS